MLHAALTPAGPTDRAALLPAPPTAAKPRGTPWRAAMAEARASHRAARIATGSTRRAARAAAADGQTRAAHTNPASNPPARPLVPMAPYAAASLLDRELAVHAAGLCVPAIRPSQGAPRPSPVAPFKPSRIDPLNREPAAKPATAPFKQSRIDPLNREPGAKSPTAPFKPFRIDPLNREPAAKPGSTAPRVTGSNASGADATPQPARAHGPPPRPGQSGEASKVRPAPAEAGGAAPTLPASPDCPEPSTGWG
jgi:hypothetical protein